MAGQALRPVPPSRPAPPSRFQSTFSFDSDSPRSSAPAPFGSGRKARRVRVETSWSGSGVLNSDPSGRPSRRRQRLAPPPQQPMCTRIVSRDSTRKGGPGDSNWRDRDRGGMPVAAGVRVIGGHEPDSSCAAGPAGTRTQRPARPSPPAGPPVAQFPVTRTVPVPGHADSAGPRSRGQCRSPVTRTVPVPGHADSASPRSRGQC